ncbi:hypothetical protein ACLM44_01070 [Synechococcus sp. W2B2]|uniref:hypothetical protein n=1 Tax=unclassified Synechococcus TaxID=2626047 RepID=UPI00006ADB2C|nr:hypothetical protein [Synechococcus sp. WH 7805]EAR17665.1 hypothetical protein WH7805_01085 [Synechococcus sp. WH 7805]
MGESPEDLSVNDVEESTHPPIPMLPFFDPLLILDTCVAVLIVLTMPETESKAEPSTPSWPSDQGPFRLNDGNTYVEHAGMAVRVDRFRAFNIGN